jgi:hypothetical protein
MQASPPRPPYGTYGDDVFPVANKELAYQSRERRANSVQSIPAILSDRNVILDEILQTKKEAKLIQSESRRGQEELQRRISILESRVLAFESMSRTVDRRSTGCENMILKLQNDFELRLREIDSEGARYRREEEIGLRGLFETVWERIFFFSFLAEDFRQIRGEVRTANTNVALMETRIRDLASQVRSLVSFVFMHLLVCKSKTPHGLAN